MKRVVDDNREEEVISILFNFPEEIERHSISEDLFYHQIHKLALAAFRTKGTTIATLQEVYPAEKWDDIANGALSSAGLPHSLEILKQYAQARSILSALTAVSDLVEPTDIIAQAIEAASSVASSIASHGGTRATAENAKDVLRQYAKNQHQIQCGIHPLLYLRRKQLVYIGARPGCGKTAIMGQIASQIMMNEEGKVLIFSLEMESGELLHRMACFHAGRFIHPQTETEFLLQTIDEWCTGREFEIDDRGALSISEIEATSASVLARGPVSMIGIDYASLIVGGDGDRRNEQIASISRRLKAMAKRLNVPVVVLAQLKREEKERPDDSSFAETDQITRDADQLWLLSCEDKHKEMPERPIAFRKVKCRGGNCASVDLWFDAPRMTFRERLIQDITEDK